MRRGAAAALGLLALAGCGSEAPVRQDPAASLWSGEEPPVERRWAAERWDTAWALGATRDDPRLELPFWIVRAGEGLFVFDAGAQRLLALDLAGRERWRFGREGAGPDEFRNVRDVKASGDSLLFLLDPQNNRVTVLSHGGEVRRRVPLTQAGHAEQMVPLGPDRIVLVTMNADTPLVVIGHAGERRGVAAFPWRGFTRLHPLARQGNTAVSPDGRRWVYGFMLGDGWFGFDGVRPERFVGRYAEHRPFPSLEVRGGGGTQMVSLAQYTPCTGCDLALHDSSLYVLSGGSDRSARAVVDRFRLRDGAYLESFRLPGRARRLAVDDGTFYVVVDEPFPGIVALRRR